MAANICDSLLANDIQGYNCTDPIVKGAEPIGVLINKSDIASYTTELDTAGHELLTLALKSGKRGYTIVQGGKTPFNGTQQEMVEGTFQNTLTNTVQFAILNTGTETATIVDALMNGTFVAVITNNSPKNDNNQRHQVYGLEAGLRASAMVRELYNDDTLSGWLVTMTEEGATTSALYLADEAYNTLTASTATANPEAEGTPVGG